MDLKELGGRIRVLREAKGWSQAELAALIGASQDAVSNWETGVRAPVLASVFRLAEALGVDPGALVGGRPIGDQDERVLLERARTQVQELARTLGVAVGAGQKHASGGSSTRTAVTATGKGLRVEDGGATGFAGPDDPPSGDSSEVVRRAGQDPPDDDEEVGDLEDAGSGSE